jgi:Do/DeqQ family serine protease
MKTLRYCRFLIAFLILLFAFKIPTPGAYVDEIRITPVVKAVEKSKAAVVSISTHEQVYERANPFSSFGSDPFFDRFFKDFYDNRYQNKSVRTHLGSGVIIDSRGYVLTNWHVVEKASSVTISTSEDKEFEAALIGADPKSDLAVLLIDASNQFLQIPFGDSENLLIGETVIAIGNPFGLSHTVTTGVVSALHRSIKTDDQVYENFIQTDASINPGNSGGPLLNIKGELIGINTAIYGQAEGIGFAIPISTAKRIVDDLLEYGEVHPPWLGISVQNLTSNVSEHLGYKGNHGAIISDIFPGSPAQKSGLKTADIIISISGQKIKSKTTYKRVLRLYTAGDVIKIDLYRQGKVKTFSIRAIEFPVKFVDALFWDGFGIEVIDNNRQVARNYGLYSSSGVVISRLNPKGQAYQKGLRPGDIIIKVQASPIQNHNEFKKQIVKNIHRESVVFLVQRGQYGYYVNFEL